MFIKGRKKSSYNLTRTDTSEQGNILTNIIQKTNSRSSSKNFDLDFEGQSTGQPKNFAQVDTDALENLQVNYTKVSYY